MSVSEQAKRIYELDLKRQLEQDHLGEFLAIEPNSKTYFLGASFIEAALAAREAHPYDTPFVLRIGHEAAFDLGCCSSRLEWLTTTAGRCSK